MAGLRTRPHFLRLLATLSSRNGLSQGVTGHTAAGTAPASHRIPFSRHLSHHDLLQSYEFFIQSFIIYMKGDRAALLDDLPVWDSVILPLPPRFICCDSVGICSLRSHIPDLRGPSSKSKQSASADAAAFFCAAPSLTRAKLLTGCINTKKAQPNWLRFASAL